MKDLNTNRQSSDEGLARLLKLAGPRPEPSSAARDQVYSQVHAAWQSRTRRGLTIRRLVPAALAATLIATVTVLLWPEVQTPVFAGPVAQLDRGDLEFKTDGAWHALQTGDVLSGDALVQTNLRTRAGVMLVNGISVRLDFETQLQFETPSRILLKHGRVYVDTADERLLAGIEVVTPAGIVRDIGTQFEVAVGDTGTRIRVRAGQIILDTELEDYHAARGESLAMTGGRIARAAIASHDNSWDWAYAVAPRFDTDGRFVSELIDWVARETGREIDYADAMTRNAAASTRITGSVSGQTPEQTLDLALATTRFKYNIDDVVVAIEKHY